MTFYARTETQGVPSTALRDVLQKMLSRKIVDFILVSAQTPYSPMPMPTLFSDPAKMDGVDPLAPVAPFNAARHVVSVARTRTGKRVAVVLRPCEIRAVIELAKLKQCIIDDLFIIGVECLGRMENDVFLRHAEGREDLTGAFYGDAQLQGQIADTCKTCDHFEPQGADMVVSVFGAPVTEQLCLVGETRAGEEALADLGFISESPPKDRENLKADLLQKRIQARDSLFQETGERLKSVEGFQTLVACCINCFNCRVACPVCYCKECVFVTDVFTHPPEVLLRRAARKGSVKMPTETSMFHLTRLAHMSHACVGCGQCSSVCPSHIPVADIFRTVACQVQTMFDYEPGRDLSEPIPYLVYERDV